MVSARQGDETGARDAGGQLAPRLEGNHLVVAHMHDKRRRLHFGQKIPDIEIVDGVEITSGALGRGRFQLQLVEKVRLLMRCPWNESRG